MTNSGGTLTIADVVGLVSLVLAINGILLTVLGAIFGRSMFVTRRQVQSIAANATRLSMIAEIVGVALQETASLLDFHKALIHRALVRDQPDVMPKALDMIYEHQVLIVKATHELQLLEQRATKKVSSAQQLSNYVGDADSLRVLEFVLDTDEALKGNVLIERAIADLKARLREHGRR